jgi:hypothetical protein
MASSNFHVINLIIRKANDEKDLTPTKYAQLFEEFCDAELNGKSSKEKECIIITNSKYFVSNKPIYYGQFVEYTNLDKRKWFNLLKKDIDDEFAIPEHLKANSVKNAFYFIAEIHRFCYSYTSKERIAPANVETFLNNALTKFFNKQYPEDYYPEINFEKEKETIEEIIQAENVFSLDIEVSYSNDFGKDMKEFFEEDMKKGHADDLHLIARNKNGESLDVNESQILRGALEASASHGNVKASIKNGKRRKTINTILHPAKYRLDFKAIPEVIKDIANYFLNIF